MIGRSVTWLFVSTLALTACGAPSPRDTVVDFLRAVQEHDIVQVDNLLLANGEVHRALFENLYFESDNRATDPSSSFEILSEAYEGRAPCRRWTGPACDPVRAKVEARETYPDGEEIYYVYHLVTEDGRYKIAEETSSAEGIPEDVPEEIYTENILGDGSDLADDAGPGRTVVDYQRAIEQRDVARLDDVLPLSWHQELWRAINADDEERWEDLERRGRGIVATVGSNDDYRVFGVTERERLFGEVYEAGYETGSFRVLSEEVYEGSTVQARVDVRFDEEDDDVVTFGLVMEDGFWRITTRGDY